MTKSNSGTRQVSLFVPELLSGLQFLKDLSVSEVPKLSALPLLLTRSTVTKDGYRNFYQGVCTLSGIENQQQDQPVAAITVAADNNFTHETNSDYFIFAEPVVMKADRDSVVLLESLRPFTSSNSLSLDESKLLISEINQHFSDEPWQLAITNQGDWYLILNANTSITTTNIRAVLYSNTHDFMPNGKDARYWRKIINEIEMLFFSSTVNENRIKDNKPAVISLWLWGGGPIPEVINSETDFTIWGDNHFLKSITKFLNVTYNPMNKQNVNELFDSHNFNHTVIVNTKLESCWQQRDFYSWVEFLKKLETTLFIPLLIRLRKKELDLITIYPDTENKITITNRSVKQWWKPVKSLTALSSIL